VGRRRSGTGRPAFAEDGGGAGDHCPNQHVQDSLFTGTGRACGKEKSRKPESREPSTPVAEGTTHSLARGKRGWPFVPDLCAVVNSDRMICLCQTPLTPRAAFPLRQRAGLLLTSNCQRPPALSRHTEFTTGLPESCERPEGATHFVAPTSACTRSTCTSTGRAFGRDKEEACTRRALRRRWLQRKPLRPFEYRLLNEAGGRRHTVCFNT